MQTIIFKYDAPIQYIGFILPIKVSYPYCTCFFKEFSIPCTCVMPNLYHILYAYLSWGTIIQLESCKVYRT